MGKVHIFRLHFDKPCDTEWAESFPSSTFHSDWFSRSNGWEKEHGAAFIPSQAFPENIAVEKHIYFQWDV